MGIPQWLSITVDLHANDLGSVASITKRMCWQRLLEFTSQSQDTAAQQIITALLVKAGDALPYVVQVTLALLLHREPAIDDRPVMLRP